MLFNSNNTAFQKVSTPCLLKGERVVEQRESKLRYNKKEMRCFRHFISFLLAVSLARLTNDFQLQFIQL